jgi:hypothetical protein
MVGAGIDPSLHTGGISVDLSYTAIDATGADYTQVTQVTFAAGVTSLISQLIPLMIILKNCRRKILPFQLLVLVI